MGDAFFDDVGDELLFLASLFQMIFPRLALQRPNLAEGYEGDVGEVGVELDQALHERVEPIKYVVSRRSERAM